MAEKLNRRQFMKLTIGTALASAVAGCNNGFIAGKKRKPNFIIIFCDDMAYSDIGCFGAKGYKTPNIDKMAKQGMRFTDFYVAGSVCTPSRAGLMTGRYPQKVGLATNCGPNEKRKDLGIDGKYVTVAEILKTAGYATACFGKWHLGHKPEFLPTKHGFDEYFGIPYSNDMCKQWCPIPNVKFPDDLPVIEGEKVIENNPDQSKLTKRYTEKALKFIEKNKDRPFFIYLPHTMPHEPIFASEKFKGKAKSGLYGDVIMEIDWSVGQILSKLKKFGINDNTMVVFTSDNGPWLSFGNHAGIAKPLREGKMTTFDGGQRVPCVMHWPGKIPAGKVCKEITTSMDLLPTFANFAGADYNEGEIEGKNIAPLLKGKSGAKSPHDAFYYLNGMQLQAVRSGKWKLHFPHGYRALDKPGKDGKMGTYKNKRIELSLFDLENDISETKNVASQYPEVVKHLSAMGKNMQKEINKYKDIN
ncbi:MAG: sulfatase-like hydrolase/transferase [Planctomycetota bacterium]|jgi:arylsulfatase A-like enzyme